MSTWTRAFLSIGSNRGDKKQQLDLAVQALEAHSRIRVTSVSKFYRTAPQNYADQDWFVNAALEIETRLDPHGLLACLKEIETGLDREGKPFRFGPRGIDLDIVLYDDLILDTRDLELPHPRMHERCFVLKPLCDIDETLVHPTLNQTVKNLLDLLETKEDQGVFPLIQED